MIDIDWLLYIEVMFATKTETQIESGRMDWKFWKIQVSNSYLWTKLQAMPSWKMLWQGMIRAGWPGKHVTAVWRGRCEHSKDFVVMDPASCAMAVKSAGQNLGHLVTIDCYPLGTWKWRWNGLL